VLWILAKKVETIRKNKKHNNLLKNKRTLNIKRSAEDGLDFAFSLPGGRLAPLHPQSVSPLLAMTFSCRYEMTLTLQKNKVHWSGVMQW